CELTTAGCELVRVRLSGLAAAGCEGFGTGSGELAAGSRRCERIDRRRTVPGRGLAVRSGRGESVLPAARARSGIGGPRGGRTGLGILVLEVAGGGRLRVASGGVLVRRGVGITGIAAPRIRVGIRRRPGRRIGGRCFLRL